MHGIGVDSTFGFSLDHGGVSFRDALPAAVAIHGVVAAANGGDLAGIVLAHFLLQLFEITRAVGWQGVASIREGVNKNAIDPLLRGHFQQGVEMFLPRVHAAVGDEAEQMQLASV